MSFRGPDPYGTPGGVDAADKAIDPPDERLAVGRVYIAYLRVNEAFNSVTRQSIEAITRILAEDLGVLVAVIIRDNGTIVDNNVGDIDAGAGLIVSQTAPGVVVIDVGAGQISTAMLADALITAAKMANNAVGTANLIDGSVTEAKLGLLSVGTPELQDDAVTTFKIAPGAVDTSALGLLSVDTAALQALAVTNAKLAANSVASSNIIDGTIVGADIANDTITATQIAVNAITASELADNAVDTAAIADGAVTALKLASGVGGSVWVKGNTAVSTAIANTTAETAYDQTLTLLGGTAHAGDWIVFDVLLDIAITGTPTLDTRMRLTNAAGTLLFDFGAANPNPAGGVYRVMLRFRAVGASGVIDLWYAGETRIGSAVFGKTLNISVDTTANMIFVLTAQWSVAAVANTVTLLGLSGFLNRPA